MATVCPVNGSVTVQVNVSGSAAPAASVAAAEKVTDWPLVEVIGPAKLVIVGATLAPVIVFDVGRRSTLGIDDGQGNCIFDVLNSSRIKRSCCPPRGDRQTDSARCTINGVRFRPVGSIDAETVVASAQGNRGWGTITGLQVTTLLPSLALMKVPAPPAISLSPAPPSSVSPVIRQQRVVAAISFEGCDGARPINH